MRGTWNGDVNLLDGTFEDLREDYDRRRALADASPSTELANEFKKDIAFLNNKLQETVKTYQKKFGTESTSKATLKELNWEIVEIVDLLEKARDFLDTYNKDISEEVHNGLNGDLKSYIRDLFMKRRERATHVLVFMVSEERRARKPYAQPVLYIPYRGMTTAHIRRLANLIKIEMDKLNMKYAGEWY